MEYVGLCIHIYPLMCHPIIDVPMHNSKMIGPFISSGHSKSTESIYLKLASFSIIVCRFFALFQRYYHVPYYFGNLPLDEKGCSSG